MSEARLSAGRRVSFLIAEKSYHRKFIGLASKIAQASTCSLYEKLTIVASADSLCYSSFTSAALTVPVARASDNAKTGKGTLYLDSSPSGDENILKGSETQFTKELGPKHQIQLGKQYSFPTVEVVEIIDDETVKVKKMFSKEKIVDDLKAAKSSVEQGGKGLSYKCLPYIDQTKVSRRH